MSEFEGNGYVEKQIHAEYATLGGHLLAEYGEEVFQVTLEDGSTELRPHPLASLGGYLLEHYGKQPE